MRRFMFRLEAVLRHRMTLESLREQDFATAQGRVQQIQLRLDTLNSEVARIVSERPGGNRGEQFDANALFDRERYIITLEAAIAQNRRRMDAAEIVLIERRTELVSARQAREVVSQLRDRELESYTALGLKTEQDTLDEAATLRHTRLLSKEHTDLQPLLDLSDAESLRKDQAA